MKIIFLFLFCSFVVSFGNITFTDYLMNDLSALEEPDTCTGKKAIKVGVLQLLHYISKHYLRDCVNVILYDKNYEENDEKLNFDLGKMLRNFPTNFINSQITELKRIRPEMLNPVENECRNFILLLKDITWTVTLLGPLRFSKVVVVTVSSRWKIEEYLEGWQARDIVNLLIVSYNWRESVLFSVEDEDEKVRDINLYTHKLYIDGLGSSTYRLLSSWRCGKLTRDVHLFPKKMSKGFNGRQFLVAASEQPPFTFKKKLKMIEEANESSFWDGVEIRLLRLLSDFLNYTMEIVEPKLATSIHNGPSERVIDEVLYGEAEIGSAGVYITNERIMQIMFSSPHTTDCAAFITKASTALPGHRAILGPFQWTVWLALTMTYMLAIIPLTFADSHSLRPLIEKPWLIENMFWHVFGTFTNCFTFSEDSWTRSKKSASRLFVGMYWAFTIIITACYTGSIVSFITLFVFPSTIDELHQLVKKNFRIGTLSTGGWARWFNNSEHGPTKWLLRDMEFVPNTTQGLKNVSNSIYLPMFRPYAFLAGRAQMEYIVKANYTHMKKKQMLHITKECFVPFSVSYVFPRTAAYSDLFNEYILRVQQSGLMAKLLNEFKWEVERSATGKLLQASSGSTLREMTPLQRKLNLADTEGMYVLMGAGYLIGLVALISEWIHYVRKQRKEVSFKERATKLKFWRTDRFHSAVNRVRPLLAPYFDVIRRREVLAEQGKNYTPYRKYDSRILGSQEPRKNSFGEDNLAYFSDQQLNRIGKTMIDHDSRSLPIIDQKCSVSDIGDAIGEGCEKNCNRRKDLDVVFGSINSLPWDMKGTLHHRNSRTLESPQSY